MSAREQIAQWWQSVGSVVAPALRAAWLGLLLAAVLILAHVARLGTPWARAIAAGSIVAVLTLGVVAGGLAWRARRSIERSIRRLLFPVDRDLGRRALRAARLLQRASGDPSVGSRELAELHLHQLLTQTDPANLQAGARRRARRYYAGATALVIAASCSALLWPDRVIEGLDVLVARDGRAPVQLAWLEGTVVDVSPPSYLRQSGGRLSFVGSIALPIGSKLEIRGMPRHPGRALVLTDGRRELPFGGSDTGYKSTVYTLEGSVELRVAARFGSVLIEEPEALRIVALADHAPRVTLQGAPHSVELQSLERLELHYRARDDHGLSSLELVLRSGRREERRVLSRPNGQSAFERGSYVLEPRDAFLRSCFFPISIHVEARDTDEQHPAKKGASEAYVLLPPPVGRAEARRFATLAAVRSDLVDSLAYHDESAGDHKGMQARLREALRALDGALDEDYLGLRFDRGVSTFLRGQAEQLRQRVEARQAQGAGIELAVLALDAVLQRLGRKDARSVAQRLGDVAEEVAIAARAAQDRGREASSPRRVTMGIEALATGARELSELGVLGADLGAVAQADLRRLARAREHLEHLQIERIARHMAQRLRRPEPSHSQQGGSTGVESGGGGRAAPPTIDSTGSDADRRFQEMLGELEELIRDHTSHIGAVELALDAGQAAALSHAEGMRREAAELATKLKQAAQELPRVSSDPNSPAASGALAREHVETMAAALEELDTETAIAQGQDATEALRETRRRLAEEWAADRSLGRAAVATGERLREALAHLRGLQRRLHQSLAERSRRAMQGLSRVEQELARRASGLGRRAAEADAQMPHQQLTHLRGAARAMEEATSALRRGDGPRALDAQHEAQRLLEQSATGASESSQHPQAPSSGSEARKGRSLDSDGAVPESTRSRRSASFRERVLEGLKHDDRSALSPAIRRYAEELLR